MRTNLPPYAVRLCLDINSGPVQSFWAAGIRAAGENDKILSTYRVFNGCCVPDFLNKQPSHACYTASKATPPGLVNAQGSLGCIVTMRALPIHVWPTQ